MERLDLRALMEQAERQVQVALMELQEHPDHQGQAVHQGRPVQVAQVVRLA
jgi:hypothetical protein